MSEYILKSSALEIIDEFQEANKDHDFIAIRDDMDNLETKTFDTFILEATRKHYESKVKKIKDKIITTSETKPAMEVTKEELLSKIEGLQDALDILEG